MFASSFPALDIPSVDLPTLLFTYCRQNTHYGTQSSLTAVSDRHHQLTFDDFESLARQFASGLYHHLGFRRQDKLATILPNLAMYPVVTMGALMAGGVVTTANPQYNAQELAHQLQLTRPKVVVTVEEKLGMVNEALKTAKCQAKVLSIEKDVPKVLCQRQFLRVCLKTLEEARDTPAFIVFSSGTSGQPKGVVLSHRNMVSNCLQFLSVDQSDQELQRATSGLKQRQWMQVLPMFHIYGLMVFNVNLLSGGCVRILEQFEFISFLKTIEKHRIDTVYVPPPIILALTKSPATKKYDLSSLVYLNSGAAPLGKELQAEAEAKLNAFVTQGYGLSETSPLVCRSLSGKFCKRGSIGQLAPNTEALFLDENDQPVNVGETGELCVRGPQVMLGYYENPSATREALQEGGLLRTGDIGYIDNDGDIFITDRKKELIKYKGFQIPPAELEFLLIEHPAVSDAAVIPVYDESRATELPKAYVVLKDPKTDPNAIRQWLDQKVVDYKRLRGGIEVIPEVPKSATGKILRRVLKDKQRAKL